jgi:hypothetical protein
MTPPQKRRELARGGTHNPIGPVLVGRLMELRFAARRTDYADGASTTVFPLIQTIEPKGRPKKHLT